MGLTGLGETEKDVVGSVCLRVIRRIKTDCLIIKNSVGLGTRIVVAIDGSPQSFGGLKTALALGKEFGTPVEAVAAFDPDFHVTAFRSLQGVLSDEAGKVFRFKEQERLHEEIINKGIAKIYQDHLETARKIAVEVEDPVLGKGMQIETKLLTGKPYSAILDYLHESPASLLILGRIGIHADEELDIGSTTENLLRLAPCNILISSRVYSPEGETRREHEMASLPWDEEAIVRLQNVPEFARPMAKSAIEEYAKSQGHEIVTAPVMLEAKEKFGG
jgi:nucleotide-binding universal stress UspA family protein